MKKMFIFGTGTGYLKMKYLLPEDSYELIGFIDNDNNKQGTIFEGKKVFSPSEAIKKKFDQILIASTFFDEIENQLLELGIEKGKIVKYYSAQDTLFDARLISLKLVHNEIKEKELKGNVAELGVFRGDFSKEINRIFSDRTLYLFDTFEGFDEKDVKLEIDNGYSNACKGRFSDTSEMIVLNKMLYKDKCIIKKGYFPDSLNGLEDKFVFVSIDVDLYKPTYAGLQYFYNRLVKGGYIFIHDYNNLAYSGVKEAIRMFCKKNDAVYFPLSDCHGSVVITK
ncbi:methyltransferase [Clostridium botulinum]|uniref:TylF/MycF/NovP-related O-methyltransferase n=1 Tax=unclassified Clostridium TaxID=2614128 RepID=UPI0004FFDA71|nr:MULTISPECIES: TylF/MycF/NovP-related O-methyltransferase [unclassified Clostridium]AIY79455.1 macrocin-O-methyltransferase family protein [Clostridium botulinum 202F]KAI3348217.1 TylF/MycF family methyltransferase [Clostridium botulinum]KFX54764.1 hypothetical protein KU40_12960 [Clostridium botulinum]KFX58794.1 hypothetical protein KU41_06175 [Clostridium botulinum]KON12950.1 hypothetical protein ACP50_13675 [Clostridium botulinum]